MKRILAIDAGTTAVTCVVYDTDLRPLAHGTREFPQQFPAPGHVEHRAGDIIAAVDGVAADVLAEAGPVDAVGLAVQRETVFALDLRTGRAIGTGLVWQDRRTAGRCRELRAAGEAERIHALTGLVIDPYFSATKIEWLAGHRDEVRRAAAAGVLRWCTVDALLVHHLTRGATCATEPTNASRTMLFDIGARAWSESLCDTFGVDPEHLPEVRPSAGHFGLAVLPDGSEVPITGVAGDQQAALFGQGGWDEGSAKNTHGTGCFLLVNTGDTRRDSSRGLLSTLAVAADGSPCHALEGSLFSGGLVVQWLRDQMGLIETAAASDGIARSVPDSHGVVLVPAFAGLGAPHWDPDARAAILGLTRGAGRAHVVRAGLEAIAAQCAEIVDVFREETGLALDELRVDGGASANDFLMQEEADRTGARLLRPRDRDTTARGAAALAGVGAGAWGHPREASALSEEPEVFTPRISAAERARRRDEWDRAVARVRSAPAEG